MKYNIVEEKNKIILNVKLAPYRIRGETKREQFSLSNAISTIEENKYTGYTPLSHPLQDLDNKFTTTEGPYIFNKLQISEKPLQNNNVDKADNPVLRSRKRKRRKSTDNTDE